MNRKKPAKKSRQRSQHSNRNQPMVDRRVMEKTMSDIGKLFRDREFASLEEANAFLQQMVASGEPIPSSSQTPLEQAQDLMYQAWDATGKRRVELARQALKMSEDCADAYVLLAEETARNLNEAKNLYEQGVKAGERALGPEAFERDAGDFWAMIDTRPYMRARLGLTQCLWRLGEKQGAIAHYTEMLKLNPGDNQGVRYILVNCLLEVDDDESLGKLLKQYEDDGMATWLYSRALWTFRQEGANKKAEARLKQAIQQNRFVPDYLLGKKRLPLRLPPYMGFGDESEAVVYASDAIKVWQKTEGALAWLMSHQKSGG